MDLMDRIVAVSKPSEIGDTIACGCSEEEFLEMRCPKCGRELELNVHHERRTFFVRCKESSLHMGLHGESNDSPDWWKKYMSGGWY